MKSFRPLKRKNQERVGHWNPRSLMSAWMLVVLVAVSPSHVVLSQYTSYSSFIPTNPQPVGSYGASFPSLSPQMQSYPLSIAGSGVSSMINPPSVSAVPNHDVYIVTSLPSPQTLPFGGVSSMPVANSPALDPFTGLSLLGAYANPSQHFQMMQGLGGLPTNLPFTNTFGNPQAGYPHLMSQQPGFNAAVNPLANFGSTGAAYQSYPHQFPNVPQTGGTGFNPSYDYLKGFKDGFGASNSVTRPAQPPMASSPSYGTQQPYTVAVVGTNSICDYAKQNCQQAYPNQFGQSPFTLQSSTGVFGGSQPSFQQGFNYTPQDLQASQYPMGMLGGPQTLLQYGGYNTPQNTQPFLGAGQSPWSPQQQMPQTSPGSPFSRASDPNLINQPIHNMGHSAGHSPSNPAHPTASFHGMPEANKSSPGLVRGYSSGQPKY